VGKNIHIVEHPEGWAVRKEGIERASAVTRTQKLAIAAGRQLAQRERSELIVHQRGGKIREKNSYGRDPHPPKG